MNSIFVLLRVSNNLDNILAKTCYRIGGITSYRMSIKIPFLGDHSQSEVGSMGVW